MRTRRILRISLATLLAGLIAACSSTPDTPQGSAAELYSEAQRQLDNGNWQLAVETLEQLETRHPFSPYAKQAQLEQIYAYFRGDIVEAAESAADRFIRENPTHPNVDYAYYMKGVIYFGDDPNIFERVFDADLTRRPAENAERSFRNFKTLVERFPDSEYTPDARQRMVYLRNRLARFEIHVADYYLNRGIWLAAANRAKNVVERFPETPALGDALEVMVQAYTELGMTTQADDARRALQSSFGGGQASAAARPQVDQVPEPPLSSVAAASGSL